jgi:hypothetical protein
MEPVQRTKPGHQVEADNWERYRDLDSQSDVVCSAPMCCWWAGDNLCLYGVPAVVQKVPYRTRVGVKRRPNDPGVKFVQYLSYDPITNKLEDVYRDIRPVERMERWLTTWLSSNKINDGLDVRVIVETYPGRAPASPTLTGSRSAALAGCVGLLYLGITPPQIAQWKTRRSHSFDGISDDPGTKLFKLAWNLTACGHSESMNMSGADTYCALVDGSAPQLYLTEDRSEVGDDLQRDQLVSLDKARTRYDETWAGGFALGDPLSRGLSWELDYAIIYSGQPKAGDNAIDLFLAAPSSMEARARFVQNRVNSLWPQHANGALHTDRLAGRGKDLWKNSVLKYASYLSLSVAESIDRILKSEEPPGAASELSRHINQYQALLRNLGLSHSLIDNLTSEFDDFWRSKGLEGAIKLTGYGRGGGLLLVSPERNLRPRFQTVLNRFADIVYRAGVEPERGVRLEFASWMPEYGYQLREQEKRGVDEQHGEGLAIIHMPGAEHRIVSPYLEGPPHIVPERFERSYSVSVNGSPPDDKTESEVAALCSRGSQFDIVYSEPKGRLYFRGVEAAKWDTTSQKHHLLVHLMLRPGQAIEASKLENLIQGTYGRKPSPLRTLVKQLRNVRIGEFSISIMRGRKVYGLNESHNVAVVFGQDSKFLSSFK